MQWYHWFLAGAACGLFAHVLVAIARSWRDARAADRALNILSAERRQMLIRDGEL
jgi:hypothetical protein